MAPILSWPAVLIGSLRRNQATCTQFVPWRYPPHRRPLPKSSLLDARLKNSATMSFAPDVLRCTLSFPGLGDVLLSLTGPTVHSLDDCNECVNIE